MSAFIERITGGQVGGTTERSIRLSLSFIRLGPVIILLLLVLAMTLLSPVFLTGANKKNAPKYLKIRERQLGALLGVED